MGEILGVDLSIDLEEVAGEVSVVVLGDLSEGFVDDKARDVDVVEDGVAVGLVHIVGYDRLLNLLLVEEFENVVGI